jgi:hypothetical protein
MRLSWGQMDYYAVAALQCCAVFVVVLYCTCTEGSLSRGGGREGTHGQLPLALPRSTQAHAWRCRQLASFFLLVDAAVTAMPRRRGRG